MANVLSVASTPISALIGNPVVCVAEETPMRQVADVLSGADISLVIVGDQSHVCGVISERDVTRAVADGLDPELTRARDVAHAKLVWCDATATASEVAAQMMDEWVRHVLVEEDGHLVGIVSARDLIGLYATEDDPD